MSHFDHVSKDYDHVSHVSEDELILYHYGESDRQAAIGGHLAVCQQCTVELEAICRVLEAVDRLPAPERGASYGAEVWRRIVPHLSGQPHLSDRPDLAPRRERRGSLIHFPLRRAFAAGAIAAMLALAFYAGRISRPSSSGGASSASNQVRERILMVAVGGHLERSQMILIELTNSAAQGVTDITEEQRRAEELVSEGRIYRQTALSSGDTAVASLLDELERTLLDIARSPSTLSSAELEALRERIDNKEILFKVRVVENNIRKEIGNHESSLF